MSGGYFDYKNSDFSWAVVDRLEEIIRDIKDVKAGIKRDKNLDPFYNQNEFYDEFTDETVKEFEKGLEYCKLATIYANRIDYLLSCDDGVETFHRRLKEDLEKFNNEKNQ